MTRADFPVVLDACVLANACVCDLFLRLAETPRLYIPKWSADIMRETYATHVGKFGWETKFADSFQAAVNEAFPDAEIRGYDKLIPLVENDPKDRHVLAAAIRGKAEVIVTFNLHDFPPGALEPWGVCAVDPADYLATLYGIDPIAVIQRIHAIAKKRSSTLEHIVMRLARHVPSFAQLLVDQLQIFELPDEE